MSKDFKPTHDLSLLGTEVTGIIDGVVLKFIVEDTGTRGRFHVKTKEEPPQRFVGLIDDGIFYKTLTLLDLFKTASLELEKEELEKEELGKKGLDPNIVYAKEIICDKCGGPLGIQKITLNEFEKINQESKSDFVEHNDSEIDNYFLDLRDKGFLQIKLKFKSCNSCKNF